MRRVTAIAVAAALGILHFIVGSPEDLASSGAIFAVRGQGQIVRFYQTWNMLGDDKWWSNVPVAERGAFCVVSYEEEYDQFLPRLSSPHFTEATDEELDAIIPPDGYPDCPECAVNNDAEHECEHCHLTAAREKVIEFEKTVDFFNVYQTAFTDFQTKSEELCGVIIEPWTLGKPID